MLTGGVEERNEIEEIVNAFPENETDVVTRIRGANENDIAAGPLGVFEEREEVVATTAAKALNLPLLTTTAATKGGANESIEKNGRKRSLANGRKKAGKRAKNIIMMIVATAL